MSRRSRLTVMGGIGLAVAVVLAACGSPARTAPSEARRPAAAPAGGQSIGVPPRASAEGGLAAPNAPVREEAAQPQAGVSPGGGFQEGVKVHGEWTLEVREPDGRLVSTQAFENALVNPLAWSSILGRRFSVGLWSIGLAKDSSFGAPSPCSGRGLSPFVDAACVITENSEPSTAPNTFKSLTVSTVSSGSGPDLNKVVLSGSATAQQTATIGHVFTTLFECVPSVAPSSPCNSGNATSSGFMTRTDITPVSVQAGQQVLATVKISFS